MLNEKQTLMRRIMTESFALTEAQLYLDSHPTCQMGLEYFRKHRDEHRKLTAEYEEKYGPLTPMSAPAEKKWEWVTEPFPWERGES